MTQQVRVRFAPSPTGPLHLGGIRTALYNYLFAKKNNGKFILRIEDTDQNRFVQGAEEYIIESLKWAGLTLDEGIEQGGKFGPYRQSDRKHLYKQYAEQLVASGNAYIAFDSKEEIEAMKEKFATPENPVPSYNYQTRQHMKNSFSMSAEEIKQNLHENIPHVIRIKVPKNEEISFNDEIRGNVIFNSSQLDDKVIFKSDGMPTYHLANIVDDYLMEITHVIRGEEWLPSTPIHVLLYRFLGWGDKMPKFAHLPLILKPDGNGKLSKRDGDRLGFPVFPLNWISPETGESSHGFRERGFLPAAFTNMLAFLGWNPGTEQEIYTLESLVSAFSIDKISHSGAKFNFEKAKWFNEQYIKQLCKEEGLKLLKNEVEIAYPSSQYSDAFLENVFILMQERIVFVQEIIEKSNFLFENPLYKNDILQKISPAVNSEIINTLCHFLAKIDTNESSIIETSLKQFADELQLKTGDLMKFLRIAIVGELSGPTVPDLIILLGIDNTIIRITNCGENIKNKN